MYLYTLSIHKKHPFFILGSCLWLHFILLPKSLLDKQFTFSVSLALRDNLLITQDVQSVAVQDLYFNFYILTVYIVRFRHYCIVI